MKKTKSEYSLDEFQDKKVFAARDMFIYKLPDRGSDKLRQVKKNQFIDIVSSWITGKGADTGTYFFMLENGGYCWYKDVNPEQSEVMTVQEQEQQAAAAAAKEDQTWYTPIINGLLKYGKIAFFAALILTVIYFVLKNKNLIKK